MKSLAILGRQPVLGLAELECIFGAKTVTPIAGGGALLDIAAKDIPFARLGGVIKVGDLLATLPTTDWRAIEKFIVPAAETHAVHVPEGKLTIGISTYGLSANTKEINQTALKIKKAVASSGRPVRIVPNKSHEISTPQIIHNKLTHANGWELVFFRHGKQTLLMRTDFVQDIESYTSRDQARPFRDARVGMLPPKLAQIIINLSRAPSHKDTPTILDPFCGSGVILQEALLMGYKAYGTDIEPRMTEYSTKNIEWLAEKFLPVTFSCRVEVGDATTHTWQLPISTFACEGYLGLPFAHLPSDAQLQESVHLSNTVIKGFLKNIGAQVAAGFSGCIAVPAWHIKGKVVHLPVLGELEKIGWQRVRLTHAQQNDLVYHRDGQIVGRELVLLVKR